MSHHHSEDSSPSPLLVPQRDSVIIPISAIRATHPGIPTALQNTLLTSQYRHITLKDALTSGNAVQDPLTGNWTIKTTRPLPSFKGLVFEAMLARACQDHKATIGREAFAWCTNRSKSHVTDRMLDEYIPFVTADSRLLNHPSTSPMYNVSSPFDVQFYRLNRIGTPELATVVNTATIAGIQVKAIQTNEYVEIVQPVLSGRYPHVLTMLRHRNGMHSYEVCQRMIHTMAQKGTIPHQEARIASSKITHPDALGIRQDYVDDYSEYINRAYRQGIPWKVTAADYRDALAQEAIALEVSQEFRPSRGGILLPTKQDIILPPES